MIKALKQFEIWRLILFLAGICLVLYSLFYVFQTRIVRGLFPNEVIVTTQGSFDKNNIVIKMLNEGSQDSIVIYKNGKPANAFRPLGFARFFIYENHRLVADFEHLREGSDIGNTYHFYLSANADSVFMDMRVEGVGSGR